MSGVPIYPRWPSSSLDDKAVSAIFVFAEAHLLGSLCSWLLSVKYPEDEISHRPGIKARDGSPGLDRVGPDRLNLFLGVET